MEAWLGVPTMVVVFIVLGAMDEIGRRAYALPRLEARLSPLTGSLLLGVVWAVWHLAQWVIPATSQASLLIPALPVWVGVLSNLLTWIFNATRGSALLVILRMRRPPP